jgi:hypothetical protein
MIKAFLFEPHIQLYLYESKLRVLNSLGILLYINTHITTQLLLYFQTLEFDLKLVC